MRKSACIENSKIVSLPLDKYLKEGASQRDRIIEEVMAALFENLPDSTVAQPSDFTLSNGTRCWIKKFHPPKKDAEGDWIYGFDVKFEEGQPLMHLEFSVRCSGWERALSAPILK